MKRLRLLIVFMSVLLTSTAMVYANRTVIESGEYGDITESYSNPSTVQLNGGAVEVKNGGSAGITEAIFVENHAKYGGAVWSNHGAIINYIESAVFNQNTASVNGGGIYSVGTMNRIADSIFTNNAARGGSKNSGYGGGIYANKALTVVDCTFVGNSAVRNGGAIAQMKGDLTVVAINGDTIFSENTKSGASNDIYMGGSKQNLKLTAYGDNSVKLEGGVDFNKDLTIFINGATSESLDKGTGTVYLGSLGSDKKRANLNLQGGTLSFINDSANKIYADKLTVSAETFLGFDVNLNPDDRVYDVFDFKSIAGSGKIVLNENSFNILDDFSEEDQSATLSLIKSSASYKSKLYMIDANGNKTSIVYKYKDGNPYLKIRLTSAGTFVFSNPQYIDQVTNPFVYAYNYSDGNNYTLNYKKNITLDSWEDLPDEETGTLKPRNILIPSTLNVNFNNKTITADDVTGMIINDENKTLNIQKTIFSKFRNTLTAEKGTVKLSQVGFKNSESDGENGAAIKNIDADVSISGSKKNNKALFYNSNGKRKDINGGAIYNEGKMSIDYVNFGANPTKKADYRNYAYDGGAIYNLQSDVEQGEDTVQNLKITNSKFIANEAGNNGGAIYNTYGADIAKQEVTVNGTFTRNTAGNNGGAIYNSGNMSVINSTFGTKNKSADRKSVV